MYLTQGMSPQRMVHVHKNDPKRTYYIMDLHGIANWLQDKHGNYFVDIRYFASLAIREKLLRAAEEKECLCGCMACGSWPQY